MTGPTQARLSPSPDPHTHVFQLDLEQPSRSVCPCGKVKKCKPIPWSDTDDAAPKSRRAAPRRKAKRPAAKPTRWRRGVKG